MNENNFFKPMVENTNEEEVYSMHTTCNQVPESKINTVGLDMSSRIISSIATDSMNIPIGAAVENIDENNSNTVGLNVNSLVETSQVKNENDTEDDASAESFNVDNDMIAPPDASFVEQKFAVQSIPADDDRSMLPDPSMYQSIMDNLNSQLSKANHKNDFVIHKGKSNFITRLIERNGADYIDTKLTADEVSRNAERIIDDMIAGRIDYTELGQHIIKPVFIDTLLGYCKNKLAINKAIQYSLGYIYNDYTNRYKINPMDAERLASIGMIDDDLSRNITQAISIVNQDLCIYEIVYNRLQYVQATKNASSLFNLATELNSARKQVKRRY